MTGGEGTVAVKSKDLYIGEHVGHEASIGGKMPMTPPASTDVLPVVAKGSVPIFVEATTTTPISKDTSLVSTPVASKLSASVQNDHLSKSEGGPKSDTTAHGLRDFFAAKVGPDSEVTDFHSAISSSPRIQDSLADRVNDSTSLPESPTRSPKDGLTQRTIGHPSTRPTSMPNRRRDGQEYPQYPNQSFQALQSQEYTSLFSPLPPRTRSSNPQNPSQSSHDPKPFKENPHISTGAKTAGNTPAQSPDLISPIFPFRKPSTADSDDGRLNTPMLHPTHLQKPKESHKLWKDFDPVSGRKTINNYEFVSKLGSGQHGTVKLGRNLETGESVAIKIVRRFSKKLRLGKHGDPNDMIKKEVAILKKARHPHVVSLMEVIDDDEFEKVYLVLEYVERGEIIWRKRTDKHVATFEMERLGREMSNNMDDEYERAAIENFNQQVPARRLEKARLLDEQKRKAQDRLAFRHPPIRNTITASDQYWSLEHGGESENDPEVGASHRTASYQGDERLSRADIHAADSAYNSPQTTIPRSHPRQDSMEYLPVSQPVSRTESSADLEGTMYGPYLEESNSNIAFQTMLNQIIDSETGWTQEEEKYSYVPCLTLSQALEAFRDTVLGLEYLHYQGIIHRDIKPANLLWTLDYRVKISDFGVSYLGKPAREDDDHEEVAEADTEILHEAIELAKTVGTPAFYAPELCDPRLFENGKSADRPAITGQIDVWALGVTLYGMIFGRLPFVDDNQFKMYQMIAENEVFIPRMRLRGVEHTDNTPSNSNKRLDDILEYEDVDDDLRNLLQRLLEKDPAQRISLSEVKYHPWVLRGIDETTSWLDETNPSVQSGGKKIEVSTQEVLDAVAPLTIVDRLKSGVQRLSSVLRGRGSRKRADSITKTPESSGSTSAPKSAKDERRTSLRGDEQIFSALRASRETPEHPLSQSVAASPEETKNEGYFNDDRKGATSATADVPHVMRPTLSDRTLSTADSMKTIRAPVPPLARERTSSPNTSPAEYFPSGTTTIADTNPSTSSNLGGIFGGAGRRLVYSMRSRERGMNRQSPSQSSRSSSVDTNTENCHASPSLALSSAIAAGHVDQPHALREEIEPSRLPNESSPETFQRAQEQDNRRQGLEFSRAAGHRHSVSRAAEIACPPSPNDEIFFAQQRPRSEAGSSSAFPISSSSDQIVSGESTPHSRIPSVVSGASSLSATAEEGPYYSAFALEKSISPLTVGQTAGFRPPSQTVDESLNPKSALATAAAEDEAGYNGEGEQDSDSEDEGLAMA